LIDFNFSPYDEDICILGAKGEGKTTFCKQEIMPLIQNCAYWIWSKKDGSYSGYGQVVHSIDDLGYGQFVIEERDKSKERFGQMLTKLYEGAQTGLYTNTVLVIEELHDYVTKQEVFQPLYHLVMTARNFGVSSIFLTTTHTAIPNWIMNNSTHFFCYRQQLFGAYEWLEKNILGPDAWRLSKKLQRKKLLDAEEIEQHHGIYRDVRKSEVEYF